MTSHPIRAITLTAAFAITSASAAAPTHATPFDGDWSVLVHTTDGHCGTTRWGLAIRGGQVYYAGGYAYGHLVGLAGPPPVISGSTSWPAHAAPMAPDGFGKVRAAEVGRVAVRREPARASGAPLEVNCRSAGAQ